MRFPARLIALGSVALSAACTSDLPAPDAYDWTVTDSATATATASTGAPGALDLRCGTPALGAVAATYSYVLPPPTGGLGPFIWNATDFDPLIINGATGEIGGVPDTVGVLAGTVTVTDSEGNMGSVDCEITVRPKIDSELNGGSAMPCLVGNEAFGTFLISGTGDGTAITCRHAPGSNGNGRMPAGIILNPITCEMEGSIAESGYGTWVWIVEADQSGAKTYLPYCASNPQPDPATYNISVTHGGDPTTEKVLIPGRGTFTPGQPISFGDTMAMDPRFEITDPSCGNPCFFGFSFFINASPFDRGSFGLQPSAILKDSNDNNVGFFHHMSVNGPAVATAFEDRPFVLNAGLDYCISDQDGTCTGSPNVVANGNANLEFGIVMFPG